MSASAAPRQPFPGLARTRTRAARLTAPVSWAVGLLAAVALLYVRDPHQSGSYGFCPWLLLTGQYCPGCGGLRAVHDLAHGDLLAAATSNVVVVAAVPVAVLAWAGWLRARWSGRPWTSRLLSPRLRGPVLVSAVAFLAAFTLVRNLGVGAWLAP